MKFRTKTGANEAAGTEMRAYRFLRAGKRRNFSIAAVVLLALAIAPGALAGNSGNATQGKATFEGRCSACHGSDASGDTPIAKAIGPIPNYRSKTVQSLTDAQIRAVITDGKRKMPPVRGVSEAEITNLIAFIRSLAKQ